VIASAVCGARHVALLYLTGYEDLTRPSSNSANGVENPGHPENFMNPGVEITTDLWVKALPMASELQWLKLTLATFNKPDFPIRPLHLCDSGDGDNMEGVSGEACS